MTVVHVLRIVCVFPVWVPLRPPVGRFMRPSVWWSAFVRPFVWVAPPPPVGRFPFLILATSILCMSSTASAAVLSHMVPPKVVCDSLYTGGLADFCKWPRLPIFPNVLLLVVSLLFLSVLECLPWLTPTPFRLAGLRLAW